MKISDRLFILIIVLFILLLLLQFLIPSQSHAGEVDGHFKIGFIPEIKGLMTELEVSYHPWHWLVIWGGIEVLMDTGHLGPTGMSFYPYRDTYFVGTQIDISKHLFIQLDHSCTHPVYSYQEQFYDKFEGGNRTEYSVGIKW